MLKKTKATIIIALTAVLAAGSITAMAGKAATVQNNGNIFQSDSAEKLLFCEADYGYIEETHHT